MNGERQRKYSEIMEIMNESERKKKQQQKYEYLVEIPKIYCAHRIQKHIIADTRKSINVTFS